MSNPSPTTSQKEWTVLVYLAADNNLAIEMAYALEQIRKAAAANAGSLNVLVYYDGNSPEIPTLYCDFSDPENPRYARSFEIGEKLYPVSGARNENAADWRSVLNFIDWGVNQAGRRAEKYALIFSGHSLGFQDIGLFRDETSGRSMTMKELGFLLGRITGTKEDLANDALPGSDAKVLLGQKLDLLGFDSCVMGMLEVGSQFGAVAKTMIASEGSIPSAGWPYEKILACLPSNGAATSAVAERIVREYIRSQEPFTVGGLSVDLAAWDLGRVGRLARALDELASSLLASFRDERSRSYRLMERALLHVHWKCQSYMYDQNVDLGDFCGLLERECDWFGAELGWSDPELQASFKEVRERCHDVLAALDDTVILSGYCGGAYQYSSGVSVFFPWSRAGYEVSRANYESLWPSEGAPDRPATWLAFLDKYLNEIAIRKMQAPGSGDEVKYTYFAGSA